MMAHRPIHDPTEVERKEYQARFIRNECYDGSVAPQVNQAYFYDAIAAFSSRPSMSLTISKCPNVFPEIMFLANVPFCRKPHIEPYFVIGDDTGIYMIPTYCFSWHLSQKVHYEGRSSGV